MNLFDLYARVALDTSEYDRGVEGVSQSGQSLASKLKGGLATAGKAAAAGIGAITGAATAAAGGLLALESSTEEYRIAQGKLNTAFEAAGFSADTAQQAYSAFYGILGDTDTATEASQLLASLALGAEDVSIWTDIAAGVYGTFGDALPIEGLIESANETARVGQVTGSLADALNWASISEDEFNAALAACTSESERNKLIMDTLSGTYDEASAAFYRNNEAVIAARDNQALLDETMANLGETVSVVKNGLLTEFLPAVANVTEAFADMVTGAEGAKEALTAAIGEMIAKAVEKLPEFIQFGVQIISSIAAAIIENLPLLVDAAISIIFQLIDTLTDPDNLTGMIEAALQIIGALGAGLVQAIPELLVRVPEIIASLVGAIIANIPQIIAVGWDIIKGLAQGLIEAIVHLPEAIAQVVTALVDGFKSLLGIHSPSTVFMEIGANLIAGLLEGISATWQTIVDFFAGAVEALKTFFAEAWETIKQAAVDAWEAIKTALEEAWKAVETVWNGAVDFFTGIWDSIAETFDKAKSFFGDVFKQAWEAVKSAWGGVKSFFTGIWNDIKSVFSGAASKFKSIGSSIVSGLKSGISGAWDRLRSWFSGKVGGLIDTAMSKLGINSPSKVFAGIGQNMVLGLGVGWENEYDSVKAQIEDGLHFEPAKIDVEASALYTAQRGSRTAGSRGGDTYNFYSPKALDAVTAAREMRKAKQQMALGYV